MKFLKWKIISQNAGNAICGTLAFKIFRGGHAPEPLQDSLALRARCLGQHDLFSKASFATESQLNDFLLCQVIFYMVRRLSKYGQRKRPLPFQIPVCFYTEVDFLVLQLFITKKWICYLPALFGSDRRKTCPRSLKRLEAKIHCIINELNCRNAAFAYYIPTQPPHDEFYAWENGLSVHEFSYVASNNRPVNSTTNLKIPDIIYIHIIVLPRPLRCTVK